MLPLDLAVFAAPILHKWSIGCTTQKKARKLVETSAPLGLSVWPCEIEGKLCLDFSRVANVKALESKYSKCYPIRLTSKQSQRIESVRSKILAVKVFDQTGVWMDQETKTPCAINIGGEIFWF
jgi:hypothetical protein